jgi:hypothetical protein
MQTNIYIYIARKTSINEYKHFSDYWSGRKLKKIELSCTIKFSVFQTILDKTLDTIPANITKLLNIDKTNLSPPPPQFNVVNNAETTFGNIPWYKLNIELGERRFKNGNMIQHGVYHKNTGIF